LLAVVSACGSALGGLFQPLLKELYDSDVVSEDAIFAWEDEHRENGEGNTVTLLLHCCYTAVTLP
jgi:hypothetical protein